MTKVCKIEFKGCIFIGALIEKKITSKGFEEGMNVGAKVQRRLGFGFDNTLNGCWKLRPK